VLPLLFLIYTRRPPQHEMTKRWGNRFGRVVLPSLVSKATMRRPCLTIEHFAWLSRRARASTRSTKRSMTRNCHLPSLRAHSRSNSISDEARDWTVVRRLARKIDFDVIDIAPAPSLRRIIALNNRMAGGIKVPPGVTIGRLVAATDMPATAAKP
jgi:hypothetical protein